MKFQSALFVLMTPALTSAFTPSHSSFVARPGTTGVTTSTFYQQTMSSYTPSTNKAPRNKDTALQMNLVDRFVRVAKSNLNSVLMNLEGPEKIMNQAVEDMQNDLLKIRQSYAEITAQQRRLKTRKDTAMEAAQDWYHRAQLALRAGDERLAKSALIRREEQLEIVKSTQTQMDTQGLAIDKLYEGMQTLEAKIIESKQKKAEFAARAKAAESTTKVNDMLSGLTGKTSMDAFRRMEEKVEALEAAAEASAEMASLSGKYLPGSEESRLETEFLRLESSAAVDDELEKMKSKLLTGSPVVDPEVEKLKKKEYMKIPIMD